MYVRDIGNKYIFYEKKVKRKVKKKPTKKHVKLKIAFQTQN